MSYRDHLSSDVGKKVRNKDLVFRVLLLIGITLFAGNLYVNSFTLVKVNGAVETVQSCVEVSGECYQERINSSQSSTTTIITAMAATIECRFDLEQNNESLTFDAIKTCVFNTLEMSPVESSIL